MKKTTIVLSIILIAFFAIGIFSYLTLDKEKIASHWDESGQVNGQMGKFAGIFLMPLIAIGLFILFIMIPKIDPLKSNIKKFKNYYDSFVVVLMFFMLYIYITTILFNFGYKLNMTTLIMPAIALLFFYIGSIMKYLKKNWFIGIRTPWTLSNDKVWEKTHKLSSKIFKLLGIIILLGLFFPTKYLILIILIPTLSAAFGLVIYSWWIYKKEKSK